MWFTVKYLKPEEAIDGNGDEVIVTIWEEDGRPFRVGGAARSVADIVAALRFVSGPLGTSPPRCGECGVTVDVPDLDALPEAA